MLKCSSRHLDLWAIFTKSLLLPKFDNIKILAIFNNYQCTFDFAKTKTKSKTKAKALKLLNVMYLAIADYSKFSYQAKAKADPNFDRPKIYKIKILVILNY